MCRFFLDSERVVCLLNVPGLLKNFAQEFWLWNLFKELIHSDILQYTRVPSSQAVKCGEQSGHCT